MQKVITASFTLITLFLTSCGSNKDDLPPLIGTVQANAGNAQAAYQKAQAAEQSGKAEKAATLYGKMADENPIALDAAKARFRQAELLEQTSQPLDAFDAYYEFSRRYPGSPNYSKAVSRQQAIAKNAADGTIRNGLFHSKVDFNKIIKMHESLRDSAPQSSIASAAQFKIGELYQSDGKANDAIAAYKRVVQNYPDSTEAPEAQYRVGIILLEAANRGNQDKGNLDRADEAFREYLTRYPNGKRNAEARKQLQHLGAQDVQRSYEVAEFYRRKGNKESARFYYNEVLKQQKSGKLHDQATAKLSTL